MTEDDFLVGDPDGARYPTPPPPPSPQARWPYVMHNKWVVDLRLNHCKINADNWDIWQAMSHKYGPKLLGLAQMVEAHQRWPDKVQTFIDRFERRNENAEVLKRELDAHGIVSTPAMLDTWKAFLTGAAGCKTLDQCLDAIKSMTELASKDGVTIAFVSHAAPYAKRWRR